MLRSLDSLNTPSNGGQNLAEALFSHTGLKEAMKTGSLSNWWSRMPRDRSSTIKSKKSRTRAEAYGS